MVVPDGSRTMPRRSYSGTIASIMLYTDFIDRHVDDLTGAVAVTISAEEREQDPERGVESCQRIPQAQIRPHRRIAGEPVDISETSHAFADRGVARARGVGSVLAIPGHPGIDQPGVGLPQIIRPQPPFFHRSRAEVLDQNVDPLGEPPHHVPTLVGPEIDGDGLFVAAKAVPPQ